MSCSIFPNRMTMQGRDKKTLLKLQKFAEAKDDDRFFRMRPFGGMWFVQSIEWRTDQSFFPPLSFTAELVQVYKTRKSK